MASNTTDLTSAQPDTTTPADEQTPAASPADPTPINPPPAAEEPPASPDTPTGAEDVHVEEDIDSAGDDTPAEPQPPAVDAPPPVADEAPAEPEPMTADAAAGREDAQRAEQPADQQPPDFLTPAVMACSFTVGTSRTDWTIDMRRPDWSEMFAEQLRHIADTFDPPPQEPSRHELVWPDGVAVDTTGTAEQLLDQNGAVMPTSSTVSTSTMANTSGASTW